MADRVHAVAAVIYVSVNVVASVTVAITNLVHDTLGTVVIVHHFIC
jgi:hypothetical protein